MTENLTSKFATRKRLDEKLEDALYLRGRELKDPYSRRYFLDSLVEKAMNPEKEYQQILEELSSRTACESFYFYVALVSKVIMNDVPKMYQVEKTVAELNRFAEVVIDMAYLSEEKQESYTKKIENSFSKIGVDKCNKLTEAVWLMIEEHETVDSAIKRVFFDWRKSQIEDYLDTELDAPKFNNLLKSTAKGMKFRMLFDNYVVLNNKKLKGIQKRLFWLTFMNKKRQSGNEIFVVCADVFEQYGKKFKLNSINELIENLFDIAVLPEEKDKVKSYNICMLLQVIEERLEIFDNLLIGLS